ncbi:hypothetical protein HDE_11115 [Halotydeus destructor]|nr:hypothetical protein HDE_11115 [Halotydeus destructor]
MSCKRHHRIARHRSFTDSSDSDNEESSGLTMMTYQVITSGSESEGDIVVIKDDIASGKKKIKLDRRKKRRRRSPSLSRSSSGPRFSLVTDNDFVVPDDYVEYDDVVPKRLVKPTRFEPGSRTARIVELDEVVTDEDERVALKVQFRRSEKSLSLNFTSDSDSSESTSHTFRSRSSARGDEESRDGNRDRETKTSSESSSRNSTKMRNKRDAVDKPGATITEVFDSEDTDF